MYLTHKHAAGKKAGRGCKDNYKGPKFNLESQIRDLREFNYWSTRYEHEYVGYSLEYHQGVLNFKRSLVLKT